MLNEKGNILYFKEISPEKKYNLKKTIRLYLGEKPKLPAVITSLDSTLK